MQTQAYLKQNKEEILDYNYSLHFLNWSMFTAGIYNYFLLLLIPDSLCTEQAPQPVMVLCLMGCPKPSLIKCLGY